jgi:iron-sulfur cluster assembly accessory protein|tara:strand:- start:728 stop:1051 length:324 start_codon:yes stop_codon:yes gene_type:complete
MPVKIPPKVTERAYAKIRSTGGNACLRVAVQGGGCSGFQYDISLEDHISQDDLVLTSNQAKVVIDPISLGFLSGSVIDYEEELIGSKFVVNNPNATSSCGCGTSFSL